MTGTPTRARLQEVGLGLIEELGYEAVTVEQIAKAAGLSHMTFFRHFATKQALVLEDPFDPAIAGAVALQSAAELPALARACRGVRVALSSLTLPEQEQVRRRVRIVATTPALTAGMWAGTLATQTAITNALIDSSPPLESRIAAAATIGALTAALLQWGLDEDGAPLADCLLAALDVLDPPSSPDPR